MRLRVSLVLAALVVAATWFAYVLQPEMPPSAAIAPPTAKRVNNTAEGPNHDLSPTTRHRTSARAGSARLLEGVPDFGTLAAKVAAASNDADALYAKSQAAGICEMQEDELNRAFARQRQRRGASKDAEASFGAFKSYRRRFCADWDGETFAQLAGKMADVDPTSDLIASQRLYDDDDKERAIAMAQDIVRNSASDTAIRNAARYLADAGGWTDGQAAVEGSYLASRLSEIQSLASGMIACEVGGGCGVDGFYAWADCQLVELCHPGISMEEIWRRTNAPDIYEAARRMVPLMRPRSE
jgi:hypothetical protein